MTTDTERKNIDEAIENTDELSAKYVLEYYKEHNPNDIYGRGGVSVSIMMELETFARWLEKQGKLKLIEEEESD